MERLRLYIGLWSNIHRRRREFQASVCEIRNSDLWATGQFFYFGGSCVPTMSVKTVVPSGI